MSVISYFGGKSSKVFHQFINTRIPKDGIKTYVEPFSGAMGTYMDDPNLKFDKVIYNDKNRHQVNLYKCCQNPTEMLLAIDNLKNGLLFFDEEDPIKNWDFYKAIYKTYQKNDFLDDMDFEIGDFEKAAMYAFLITSAHNSVYPRGAGFNGYKKKNGKLKIEALVNKLKKDKYTEKLESIDEFYNIDFEELINKYDSVDTFLYLDPPYARFDESKGMDDARRLFWYGCDDEGVFGPESHRRLLELLKKTDCRWSLSYYYFPLLEELLPRDQYIWVEKEVFRSSAHGGNNSDNKKVQAKGVEMLIMNYDPETGEKINNKDVECEL